MRLDLLPMPRFTQRQSGDGTGSPVEGTASSSVHTQRLQEAQENPLLSSIHRPHRILVHDRSGHPFTVQLSRELARRGHHVLHSYAEFFQSPKGDMARKNSDPDSLEIDGISLDEPFQKYSYAKRYFQERKFAQKLTSQIEDFGPDVAVFANMPPDAQTYVYRRIGRKGIRSIFWVQDIYGIAIRRILHNKLSVVGDAVGKYYIRMERALLRDSDEIILITEDFLPIMQEWGIPPHKLHVIPNWAPIDEIPVRPKSNPWSVEMGLQEKFCILYSGTLGMKHNPDLLFRLASHFESDDRVRIVVISEGIGADWLSAKAAETGLSNLVIRGFQPFEALPDVLGSADILAAILEPDAGVYSVPSKVLSYLCAQRPVLLAVPAENLAARSVVDYQMGIVVDPTDVEGFIEAAGRLLADPGLGVDFARNARRYAETNFDISRIADRFERIGRIDAAQTAK